MRIALCNEVIAAMPFERQCAFARSVGYDAIEIAPFTLTDDPARLPATQAAPWRRAATDAGIAITSLHYLLRAPPELSITASDAGQRRRTVDVMRALCGLAAARSTSGARWAGGPPISAPASWCMARPINARSPPAKRTTGAGEASIVL